jgi:chorismate mutase
MGVGQRAPRPYFFELERRTIEAMTICRGVRGATTVEEDNREAILSATRELLTQMIEANHIQADDVASAIFTTTADLTSEYPALAARQLGWHDVALLCAQEINVPNSINQCIRILLHWNTEKPASEISHIYIRDAVRLRPDRAVQNENSNWREK